MSAEDKMSILRDEAGEESMEEGGVELGADGRRKPSQHKYNINIFLFMRIMMPDLIRFVHFSNYTVF